MPLACETSTDNSLWAKRGNLVRLARSIGRPLRYFLAKRAEGPCLIIAERIDEIAAWLRAEGFGDQFHPSYTRMVPAHHLIEIALLGCPDPSPTLTRFFAPQRNRLSPDLDEIGAAYIAHSPPNATSGSTELTAANRSACSSPAASTAERCSSCCITCCCDEVNHRLD